MLRGSFPATLSGSEVHLFGAPGFSLLWGHRSFGIHHHVVRRAGIGIACRLEQRIPAGCMVNVSEQDLAHGAKRFSRMPIMFTGVRGRGWSTVLPAESWGTEGDPASCVWDLGGHNHCPDNRQRHNQNVHFFLLLLYVLLSHNSVIFTLCLLTAESTCLSGPLPKANPSNTTSHCHDKWH